MQSIKSMEVFRNYFSFCYWLILLCLLFQTIYAQKTNTKVYFELISQAEEKMKVKQWDEAAKVWEQVVRQNPVEGKFWNQLGISYYNSKKYRQAVSAYQKAFELGFDNPSNTAYNIVCNFALLGEKESALKWLEKSFSLGFSDLKQAQTDSDLKSISTDSRYKNIVGLIETSKMSREMGWRTDLDFLVREIKRRRFGRFKEAEELEFNKAVQKLRASIPKLSDAQIIVELMKITTLIGDGHSGLLGSERPEFIQTLPVQLYLFEEGLFIISGDKKHEDLLGAEVLKFGELTPQQIISGLEPIISRDNSIWIKQVAPYRMRHLPLLNALGLIPDSKKVSLTVRFRGGNTKTVTLETDTTQPNIWNTLPNPASWVNFQSTLKTPLPLYLKNIGTNFWFEYLPESKTVYFQFNRVRNGKDETFAAFCQRLFKFTTENEVEKLVIDLRWNNGGNTNLLQPLIHSLIKNEKINQDGKLFVITGRRTFSAAQNASTFIERNTKAIFIGEPTGSSPNFVGEEEPFLLPYSKILANVSDLFWVSSFPQDKRTWIAPKIYVPPTFKAFSENRDEAFETILNYETR